jgi:broad specificity phosphatase PhoE
MRLVLLSHAATAATRTTAFPGDEPLDPAGRSQAGALAGTMPRADQVRCAPSTRCWQTAEATGLHAVPDAGLSGCDFGEWTGRTLDEVVAEDPDAVTAWLTDPTARPHGGESICTLLDRVGRWVDGRVRNGEPPPAPTLIAIADPTVIRAAVVHAIDAPPRSIWRIDIAPLSQTVLAGGPGRWSLRSIDR